MDKNNKKFLLILFIPFLFFLFSDWFRGSLIYGSEGIGPFYPIFTFFIIAPFYAIVAIVYFAINKLLKGLNDYLLVSIICVITFILIFIFGGFNGFILKGAFGMKNMNLCNAIVDTRTYMLFSPFSPFQTDKDFCMTRISSISGQESSCENVSLGGRARCYESLALQKGDPSICGEIKLEFGDHGVTNGYPLGSQGGRIREECYMVLAERKKDTTICEQAKVTSEEWCLKDQTNAEFSSCRKVRGDECCKEYGEKIKTDCYQRLSK